MRFALSAVMVTAAAAASMSAQQTAGQPPAQQQQRPLSPPGFATTMLGGTWAKNAQGRDVYEGGKWIEVIYSRPMLRQRDNIFGSGADYGVGVRAGAPVWRAGANATTLFRTQVPLLMGGKTVPAGEYGLLIDLKGPKDWTLILSSQDKAELAGAAKYDPKFDVVRVPMTIDEVGMRVDQMSIFFCDVTKDSGKLAVAWDRTVALVPFTIAAAATAEQAGQPPAVQRPLSPRDTTTAMLGGAWVKNAEGNLVYQGGKWIEVDYGRPMLRQRQNIFGSGAEYGQAILATAPLWRIGANQSTRFRTEVPLVFGGKTLPAGEYSMFADLKSPSEWTLIFSTWPAQQKYDPNDKTALWGAYGYTPEKDVLRATMKVDTLDASADQLAIVFGDVTQESGVLAIVWEQTIATIPFTVAK